MVKTNQNLEDVLKGRIYPWDKWFDGSKRTLKKGRHFNCSMRSFSITAYNLASKAGMKITVKAHPSIEDAFIVQRVSTCQ